MISLIEARERVAYDPYCRRWAHEIPGMGDTIEEAHEYVLEEEGALNPENNHFACDECYIRLGMPTTPWGWVAQ